MGRESLFSELKTTCYSFLLLVGNRSSTLSCTSFLLAHLSVTEQNSAAWAGKIVASYTTKRLSQDVIQVSQDVIQVSQDVIQVSQDVIQVSQDVIQISLLL